MYSTVLIINGIPTTPVDYPPDQVVRMLAATAEENQRYNKGHATQFFDNAGDPVCHVPAHIMSEGYETVIKANEVYIYSHAIAEAVQETIDLWAERMHKPENAQLTNQNPLCRYDDAMYDAELHQVVHLNHGVGDMPTINPCMRCPMAGYWPHFKKPADTCGRLDGEAESCVQAIKRRDTQEQRYYRANCRSITIHATPVHAALQARLASIKGE